MFSKHPFNPAKTAIVPIPQSSTSLLAVCHIAMALRNIFPQKAKFSFLSRQTTLALPYPPDSLVSLLGLPHPFGQAF